MTDVPTKESHVCICCACKKSVTLPLRQFIPEGWTFEAQDYPPRSNNVQYDDFSSTCVISYYCYSCSVIKDILE